MKFPSIDSVVKGASLTFLRFPVAILLAVVATAFCIGWVRIPYDETQAFYWFKNVIAAAYLGMLLSVALTVYSEKNALRRGVSFGLQAGGVVLAVLYYFTLPDHYMLQALIRLVLFALALHWLIACIGFTDRENNGFWLFNKKLFLRILTSMLYTLVLYGGLMLALYAIEKLFNVQVNDKLYAYVWWVLLGIFNTWFFLAGFPADYENPAVVTDYPRGLKVFTQYVLLPILTVYLLILYAYLFRIIITAVWPYGWVAYLVLGFSVAGILSILLVWPLREEESNKWISGYSRFFYFALLPLIIMLFIAIWKRVAAYGITELRYFVLLLAAWLLFMALYFLISKRKNIRLIPLSLCVAAFLASFGPWGSSGVSLYSQRQRLKAQLTKNKMLAGGKITGEARPVPLNDRKEITSMTDYIVEVHGYRELQPLFRQNLDTLLVDRSSSENIPYYRKFSSGPNQSRLLLDAMKIEYADRYATEEEVTYFNAWSDWDTEKFFPIKGYDYLVADLTVAVRPMSDTSYGWFGLDKDQIHLRLDSSANQLLLYPTNDSALVIDLSSLANAAGSDQGDGQRRIPFAMMTRDVENGQWACRLMLQRFNGRMSRGARHITEVTGHLLLKKK